MFPSDTGAKVERQQEEPRRQSRIGGGSIAAICGVDAWRGPIDVWVELVEGFRTPETPAMRRGKRLERYVRELYAEETGAELAGPVKLGGDLWGAPWAIASLDDRWVSGRPVELKTARERIAWKWGDPEDLADPMPVPTEYYLQVQWYLWITGEPLADLAVLIGNDDLRIYPLPRNERLICELVETAERFWRDYVVTKQPPPIDESKGYERYLLRTEREEDVRATPEQEQWAEKIIAARKAQDEARRLEAFAKHELLASTSNAKSIRGAGWTLRVQPGRRTTKWQEVAKELKPPKTLIEQHTTQAEPSVVFQEARGSKWH